jgi:HKD family nuclease
MKITLHTQPFDDDNNTTQLGDVLIDLLNSTSPIFDKITIISAFANYAGIQHLLPHLQSALSRNVDISFVIGIDHKSTSIEALTEILALGVETKIVHNNRPGHTFHPKIYLFESSNEKAELFIGSNNLTEGGLFTNYEAATHITFELPEDEAEYHKIKRSLERFINPPDAIFQPLTVGLIENLAVRGEIISEIQRRVLTRQSSIPNTANVPVPQFGNETIKRPLLKRESLQASPSLVVNKIETRRGKLLWEKKLPASDLEQSQIGNPIGGLKLTQARWKVDGQVIDQTTYFRDTLFEYYEWTVGERKPTQQETTIVRFDVYILSVSYGLYDLIISHKPSGESGQGNYTTKLHWGDLTPVIRNPKLVGRMFRLYAPLENSDIFTIEII